MSSCAGQAHAHRPPGLPRAQRGDGGAGVGLHLLAAERAAHAQALHRDLVRADAEHARDDLLRLGGMLRGRVQRDTAALVEPRHRGLRLEIEMLLSADSDLAVDPDAAARRGPQSPRAMRTGRQ